MQNIGPTFVSIIIPVLNNRKGLRRSLQAIQEQTLNKELFEVIVVDNGSCDDPIKVIDQFKNCIDIKFFKETTYLNSPYSARNRGIEVSKGEVIVLLDSTCAPVKVWLEAGLDLIQSGADMIGGEIAFDINKTSSIGELYDSLVNVNMKDTVLNSSAAKGGNLFFKREVFDKLGPFPEGLRSGGDLRWTYKATQIGFILNYSDKAKVLITPRGLQPLIKKQFRVGKGQPLIWKESNVLVTNIVRKVLLGWLPPNPRVISKRISEINKPYIKKHFIKLLLVGWYLRLVNAAGNIAGLGKVIVKR